MADGPARLEVPLCPSGGGCPHQERAQSLADSMVVLQVYRDTDTARLIVADDVPDAALAAYLRNLADEVEAGNHRQG